MIIVAVSKKVTGITRSGLHGRRAMVMMVK